MACAVRRGLWCETLFRHLPKRMFTHTGGDRGKAECGASAEGWRERPALRCLGFGWERDRGAVVALNDSGPPSPPSPSAPLLKPRSRGLLFSWSIAVSPRLMMLAAIRLHTYTVVQWNGRRTNRTLRVVRQPNGYLSPDTPAFRFLRWACGSPSPDVSRTSWQPNPSRAQEPRA